MNFSEFHKANVVHRNRRHLLPRGRRGLSLLEVILSVAILGGSMAVIGNLYHLGYRSGLKSQLLNEANMIAGSTMSELVVGVRRGDEESAVPASISIVRLIPDPDYEPEEDME